MNKTIKYAIFISMGILVLLGVFFLFFSGRMSRVSCNIYDYGSDSSYTKNIVYEDLENMDCANCKVYCENRYTIYGYQQIGAEIENNKCICYVKY
ncbi:MAG: hypothetical protein WC413_01555 [Candidatus Nanoarchaeia archaeon]